MNEAVAMILAKWPSNQALADDLELRNDSHCRTMKARGRIPRAYWHDLVAAAERRGIKGVTIARLKKIHAEIGTRRS